MATPEQPVPALHAVTRQIEAAIAAPKCHKCGCFQQTVGALAETEAGRGALAPILTGARGLFAEKI